jgi:hypothetical protein
MKTDSGRAWLRAVGVPREVNFRARSRTPFVSVRQLGMIAAIDFQALTRTAHTKTLKLEKIG